MKAQLEEGVELKEGARRWASRYMTVSKQGRGGVPKPDMTKERLRLEKGLADWIRGRSTVDIFDWFDCIETTEVKTEAGKFR